MATNDYTLKWDGTGDKLYETGTKNGVVYPALGTVSAFAKTKTYSKGTYVLYDGKKYKANADVIAGEWDSTKWTEYNSDYDKGVAFNGLTGISESPDGADETALYADDIKYLSLRSAENFGYTITAYTYPDEFEQCDGTANVEGIPGVKVSQQKRRMFGFSYITVVGNDTDGNDYAEKLHIIYSSTCSPTSRDYQTINDSPEAVEFSWECETTPIDMPGDLKKGSQITIDTSKFKNPGNNFTETQLLANYETLKELLWGDGTNDAYLPMPAEIATIMSSAG